MNLKVELQRIVGDTKQTTGTLSVLNDQNIPIFISVCIERGYRNNQRNISNVPSGIYDLVFEYSPKFKTNLWELKGVPGRSECKIHSSNYWYQLNGCISVGSYLTNLNKDSYLDLAASKRALNDFHRVMSGIDKTTIQIIDPIGYTPF